MTGVELIAKERERQVTEEGWISALDDKYTWSEMAVAASCYSRLASDQSLPSSSGHEGSIPPAGWPWEICWWKPSKDPIRNLVKAGALIAAEIDRLQRKEESK